MTNDIIKLDTLSPNFQVLNGSMGQRLWFSYGVLIAVYVGNGSTNVWTTPKKYSVTTTKHTNQVTRWAEEQGYKAFEADTEDDLHGWAA